MNGRGQRWWAVGKEGTPDRKTTVRGPLFPADPGQPRG